MVGPNWLQDVLDSCRGTFASKGRALGFCAQVPPMRIETTGNPIRQRPYRQPLTKRKMVEEEITKMLEDDVIQPSMSSWSSPVTLVPKKDGTTRFCIDYRKLNSVTIKDAHPLPNIQEIFDQLQGAEIFSTLDLKAGYWQLPMAEEDRHKTAFVCHKGLFEFKRLPFGLANAPGVFQRTVNYILGDLVGKCCFVYIDDIIVYSQTKEEHRKHVEEYQELLLRGCS